MQSFVTLPLRNPYLWSRNAMKSKGIQRTGLLRTLISPSRCGRQVSLPQSQQEAMMLQMRHDSWTKSMFSQHGIDLLIVFCGGDQVILRKPDTSQQAESNDLDLCVSYLHCHCLTAS